MSTRGKHPLWFIGCGHVGLVSLNGRIGSWGDQECLKVQSLEPSTVTSELTDAALIFLGPKDLPSVLLFAVSFVLFRFHSLSPGHRHRTNLSSPPFLHV